MGIPGSGKTYLALQHLREAMARNGWPALLIDSIGEEQVAHVPHARSVREAIEWVWGAGESAAYIPPGIEEVNALLRPCLEVGRVNVWIDEAHTWLTARRGTDGPLLRLMRTHRHARVNLFLTAQHLTGDVPQEALSCAPEIYCFRCTSPAVLERLGREGIDPDVVRALPSREFVRHYEGF